MIIHSHRTQLLVQPILVSVNTNYKTCIMNLLLILFKYCYITYPITQCSYIYTVSVQYYTTNDYGISTWLSHWDLHLLLSHVFGTKLMVVAEDVKIEREVLAAYATELKNQLQNLQHTYIRPSMVRHRSR